MIFTIANEARTILVLLPPRRHCQRHAGSFGVRMEAIPKFNASIRRPRHWISYMEESKTKKKKGQKEMKKLGIITFGKSRPAPKEVLVDVTYDEKTGAELFKIGMLLLKKDKDTVIGYVIRSALMHYIKK